MRRHFGKWPSPAVKSVPPGGYIVRPELKRDWTPSETSFRRLLAWLDEGVDSGGERYLDMRRRLSAYFDRRGCRAPEDLADETLNRVARRLEEEGTLSDGPPGRYCYIVAKFVLLEDLRRERRERGVERDGATRDAVGPGGLLTDLPSGEARLGCLDRCLEALPARDRDLILGYYADGPQSRADRRRALAERLHLSPNALAIRACRLRDTLEACVRACLEDPS